MFLRLLHLFTLLFLQSDPPGNGDDPLKPDDPKPDDPPKVTYTADQQADINRIVTRETKQARDKAVADTKAAADAAQTKAEQDAQRKKQEEAGEFDKVRTSLEQERDTVSGERDSLKTENEALTTYFTTDYEAALKTLPDIIKEFAPDDDAAFSVKSAWLTKAKAGAARLDKDSPHGNRANPKPGEPTINQQEEVGKVRQRPAFRSL